MQADRIALRAEGIVRSYGATRALRGVDFDLAAGAVNVLIGENGAGKSTLMRILAGVERPDTGRLLIDGRPVSFTSVQEAARCGIGIVFQELNLCPNLTVVENMFLGRRVARGFRIDRSAERVKAVAVLARLRASIDPDARVGDLRIGQQQIVEIARALAEDARILILDEPTSALSESEVATLFQVIDELRRDGVAIVYISHRLEELMRIGDRITVMRDGRVVATAPVAEASVPWIVERMLGENGVARSRRRNGGQAPGAPVLQVENVSVRRPAGGTLVDDVSLTFRSGEVVAIYGLLGAGRTELFEYIQGARRGNGVVRLCGERIDRLPIADRIERRLLLVPEDRQREGLFPNLRVGGNLGLSVLRRFAPGGMISPVREGQAVRDMIGRLGIKARGGETPIGALSGGNQQKVVIGRCVMRDPAAILLDEPSRGVDVGARAEVFDAMRSLSGQGIAIAFTTSDLAEALTVADRVVVMAAGRVTADLPAEEADETMLVRAANGVSSATATIVAPLQAAN
ncbi:erythritol ABC transporter ATP-binding protein [Sphingomonas gellani]|uniref:Erythritol ABC transporter ATP-binding protein n=1 Tax=Sphingomonas gellani TaxID=1166340 RepID=A0A1H8JUK4_9SPHN|nr:sugar ABC transporter ATP-binding protein [Sphingomonas gellani]SEN84185.1 erythritol ABC transporter ATP-binding protein [Sphingomonas gellani]